MALYTVASSTLWLVAVACLATKASAHGKEHVPRQPRLSHSTLAAVYSTVAPPAQKALTETVKTCFTGYTLMSDGTCVKEIDEPAYPACPSGTLVGQGCEIQVPYLFRCPNGYEEVAGGLCNRTIEVPPQFYCPVGFYDDGNSCARTTPGEVITQCDVGELVGDNCISVQHAEQIVTAVCPEGAELEADGNCWKIIDTFDCSEARATESSARIVVAPKHHVPIGKKVLVTRGKGAKLRNLLGVHPPLPVVAVTPPGAKVVVPLAEAPAEAEPCPEEMIAVSAPRPTKVNVASQVCHKKIQVEAQAVTSCPEGYLNNDTGCIMEKVTSPTTICLSGVARNGSCPPVTKRAPKYPGCPKHAVTIDGKCFGVESKAGASLCPTGFTDNGKGCVGVVETPGLECPFGLHLVNDRCVGQKVRPAVTLQVQAEAPCIEEEGNPQPMI